MSQYVCEASEIVFPFKPEAFAHEDLPVHSRLLTPLAYSALPVVE